MSTGERASHRLQSRPRPVPRNRQSISTVGITTADLPQHLERCLSSLTRQLGAQAEHVRIVVVDASKNSRNESLGRSAVAVIRDVDTNGLHDLAVEDPDGVSSGVRAVRVDGTEVEGNLLPLAPPGATVEVEVVIG